LEVRDVSRLFGGNAAVDHVSLDVFDGEAVGLIGANGAGKTTLFRMIAGELALSSGKIQFDAAALPRRTDQRARLGIARTFQLVQLFGGLSVIDHLLVALQAHEGKQGPLRDTLWKGSSTSVEEELCLDTLRLCGLSTVADAPATALSLGERRAVELARALVVRPRLLLADEPSSGLDTQEAARLARVIAKARAETGLAVLLVEHDLQMVEAIAERVIAMDAGRVIAQGNFDEVLRDERVVASWLGRSA
jgi:ABC-type branched-subunit amino acid transport system ATPase component